jgi:putative tryptophan/tyrosine transport system substrate-binding protein
MDRRTFIGMLACSLLVASFGAEAQRARKVYRIGFLLLSPRDVQMHLIAAFEAGLREKGYTPGREVVIEYRSADGHSDQLPILAAELVRLGVDVIVTGVNPNTFAAKRATDTIPIVMASSFFPVEDGLVASLARPGGNITGLTQEAGEEVAKRLQILREVAPKLTRVATLSGVGMTYNPYFVQKLQDAARGLGVSILPFEFQSANDIGKVFLEIEHARADGLIVFGGPITIGQRSAIVSLTAEKRLPAVWTDKQFVLDGGLMSYGADVADIWRRSAGYVDRILKGAKPADLPVEQPTKFVLAINLKTAKQLGLTIPQSLLQRADEVIQ